MANNPLTSTVTAVFLRPRGLSYPIAAFEESVQSALSQDTPPTEVLVIDGEEEGAGLTAGTRRIGGRFENRAAMLARALEEARGDWLMVVRSDEACVRLRRSALRTMLMAAERESAAHHAGPAHLVYADYERIGPDGSRRDVHLLPWHEGRLRDAADFGSVVLMRAAALRALGGFDARLRAAEWYDARLKLTTAGRAAHIANRYAGALYSVAAGEKKHNVFDYLLAGRDAQIEMESVFTSHLKRIGAYLEPGAHVRTEAPIPRITDCIASVVTPVNRRPEFIGRAIESVQAQTVQNIEMIVVVNGGADDPTSDEVRRYMPGGDRYDASKPAVRLIVVDVNNLGLCLNSGIGEARGKYYVQLDSDDRLKPDAVARLLNVFEQDPSTGMVVGSYEVWTLDEQTGALRRNEEIPVVTHEEWTAENGRNNLLRIGGAGAPRSARIDVIAAAGWFGVNDTAHCRNYGEDYDLVLRISECWTIGRVWEPIYEVIRHSGGTDHSIDQATINRNDEAKDAMRGEALARRRRLNAGPR